MKLPALEDLAQKSEGAPNISSHHPLDTRLLEHFRSRVYLFRFRDWAPARQGPGLLLQLGPF